MAIVKAYLQTEHWAWQWKPPQTAGAWRENRHSAAVLCDLQPALTCQPSLPGSVCFCVCVCSINSKVGMGQRSAAGGMHEQVVGQAWERERRDAATMLPEIIITFSLHTLRTVSIIVRIVPHMIPIITNTFYVAALGFCFASAESTFVLRELTVAF